MFIDKETKVWVNIDAPYKGFSKLDTPEIRERAGLVWIDDPAPPADYSDETHSRNETPDRMPPYVTFERKSDEQLAELSRTKTNATSLAYLASTDWYLIRQLERGTPMPYAVLEARQKARDAIVNTSARVPSSDPV